MREFEHGDPMLVLQPQQQIKLMAQWQGPYQVLAREGQVTYLVDMHDSKKRLMWMNIPVWKEEVVQKPNLVVNLVQSN